MTARHGFTFDIGLGCCCGLAGILSSRVAIFLLGREHRSMKSTNEDHGFAWLSDGPPAPRLSLLTLFLFSLISVWLTQETIDENNQQPIPWHRWSLPSSSIKIDVGIIYFSSQSEQNWIRRFQLKNHAQKSIRTPSNGSKDPTEVNEQPSSDYETSGEAWFVCWSALFNFSLQSEQNWIRRFQLKVPGAKSRSERRATVRRIQRKSTNNRRATIKLRTGLDLCVGQLSFKFRRNPSKIESAGLSWMDHAQKPIHTLSNGSKNTTKVDDLPLNGYQTSVNTTASASITNHHHINCNHESLQLRSFNNSPPRHKKLPLMEAFSPMVDCYTGTEQ